MMAIEPVPAELAAAAAVQAQIAAVERYAAMLQAQPVIYNGHTFYADLDATRTIETTLLAYSHLADSDPVPVPYPLQSGYWMTADFDQSGNRILVSMTMGEFRALGQTLMERNASIWGRKQIHFATIEALPAEGWTAQQIMAYDITQGWE